MRIVAALNYMATGEGIDPAEAERPYLVVFALIALDAVVPIVPGETTSNTAATAASQRQLDLTWIIVAGAPSAPSSETRRCSGWLAGTRPRSSRSGGRPKQTPGSGKRSRSWTPAAAKHEPAQSKAAAMCAPVLAKIVGALAWVLGGSVGLIFLASNGGSISRRRHCCLGAATFAAPGIDETFLEDMKAQLHPESSAPVVLSGDADLTKSAQSSSALWHLVVSSSCRSSRARRSRHSS
jgi:uncharacterized membrane protein